jgi:hypothetical protein
VCPLSPGYLNVDVFDALLVLQYSVGLNHPVNEIAFKTAAHVAPLDALGKPLGDSQVNVFDALAILRHAVNLDDWSGIPKPPTAPTNLKASPGNASITFTWDTVSGATAYNLYYGTTSGVTTTSGIKIAGVASQKTLSGLTNGIPYYAVITAVNANGESSISSEVSATPVVEQNLASLIVGNWAFDASQSIWPGDSPVGFTGTLTINSNKTFSQTLYNGVFLDTNISGTYTISGNTITAKVLTSNDPESIGQIYIATLTLQNNNTLIMSSQSGDKDVYNRK